MMMIIITMMMMMIIIIIIIIIYPIFSVKQWILWPLNAGPSGRMV